MKTKLLKPAFSLLLSCFIGAVFAQTAGTLTFTFTPVSHSGYQGTKNVLAVWIQTSTGAFVKTKIRNAGGSTSDHLPTWAVNAGGSASNCSAAACNVTDATTGATLANFTKKTITWDGKNVSGKTNGTVVADGTYKVTIQSTWNHGSTGTTTVSYTFTKGPKADHQKPANDANFTAIALDWVPESPSGIDDMKADQGISVFPNPSSGIVNVSYLQADVISVINVLGKVVAEEKINSQDGGTKSMDLSNVANKQGVWNYKIILDK